MKTIKAVDLFCGAGGTSTGLTQAAQGLGLNVELLAVNHWERAIQTHAENHPWAEHLCTGLDSLKPEKVVPGGELDLLMASPECTHHSIARGGKPRNDQSRASAWHVLYWCQELYVKRLLIENVPEFVNWGPLDRKGTPLKSKRGATFNAFIDALKSLGYRVDYRCLTCADYGDATTRRRFFLQAVRGNKKILWPEQTHQKKPEEGLFGKARGWVPARDVIDWTLPSTSIFERKRPLVANTIKRIEEGIRRYWGAYAEPFIIQLRGTSAKQLSGSAQTINQPIPTVTAGGGHCGLIEPFIIPQHSGGSTRGVSKPVPTVCTQSRGIALVEPFIVKFYGNGGLSGMGEPLSTATTKSRFGLVQGDKYQLDIRFRMLQPHELAAAHSFPADYKFAGNKTETIKQIGNSVPVATAKALCEQLIAWGE